MSVADRLIEKAKDYEQRSAHHAERAELAGQEYAATPLGDSSGIAVGNRAMAEEASATGFALVAIALREVAQAVMEEREEDLAA